MDFVHELLVLEVADLSARAFDAWPAPVIHQRLGVPELVVAGVDFIHQLAVVVVANVDSFVDSWLGGVVCLAVVQMVSHGDFFHHGLVLLLTIHLIGC